MRSTAPVHKNGDAKEHILEAAAELFMERGYQATSVRAIGERLGISQSSLYYHARSKPQILIDLNRRFLEQLMSALDEISARDLPAVDKLRAVVASFLHVVAQNQAEVTVALEERRSLPLRRLRDFERADRKAMAIIDQILREGIAAGEFRDLDVPVARLALIGMCSWAHHWYDAEGRLDSDEIASRFTELFLDGIRRPQPSRD